MGKYTDGPYEICLGSGEHVCTGIKSRATGQMIADVCPDYFLEHGIAVSIEEQGANMTLLVSAPELLESLEAMVEFVAEIYKKRGKDLGVSEVETLIPVEWHIAKGLIGRIMGNNHKESIPS